MNATIENYRGIEIWFDTNNESFQCDIDDSRSIKKSYPAIKKFIDDWKKDNNEFKPFKVEPNPLSRYGSGKRGTVIGIRKDGRFVIQLENDKKEQISDYDLDGYILHKNSHSELWNKLTELKEEEDKHDAEFGKRRQAIKDQFQITTLKEIKKSYDTPK